MNYFLSSLDVLFVFLRGGVVDYLLDLDVFSLDALDLLFLQGSMLPVLVELRKAGPDIVNEKLGKLFVCLNDKTEKLAMVVVDHLANFLLKRERFELFPRKLLGL